MWPILRSLEYRTYRINEVRSSETEALAAVDRYLAALNARDEAAIRDAFNFPHVRIGADGNFRIWKEPQDYHFEYFRKLTEADGWHHTEWDKIEIVFATDAKVHVAVNFSRYREDNSLISRYFSLYVVTYRNGHWGIQAGSGDGT